VFHVEHFIGKYQHETSMMVFPLHAKEKSKHITMLLDSPLQTRLLIPLYLLVPQLPISSYVTLGYILYANLGMERRLAWTLERS